MLLRNIFSTLLQDSSAAEYASQVVVDEHVARALLQYNDPDLTLDLRKSNDNPHSTIFYSFCQELQHYLKEATAVDERRHSEALHMPIAISVRHLHELIKESVEEKFPECTGVDMFTVFSIQSF